MGSINFIKLCTVRCLSSALSINAATSETILLGKNLQSWDSNLGQLGYAAPMLPSPYNSLSAYGDSVWLNDTLNIFVRCQGANQGSFGFSLFSISKAVPQTARLLRHLEIFCPHLFPWYQLCWRGLFHRRRPPTSLPSQFLAPYTVHYSKQCRHAMSEGVEGRKLKEVLWSQQVRKGRKIG